MRISIIGTGYVGLVVGACLADIGHDIICVDNNAEKVEGLKKGVIPIYEPGLKEIVKRNKMEFTTDISYAVTNTNTIFIALPTPEGEDGSADLSHILNNTKEISEILKDNTIEKTLVIKSTVPVGTSEKVKKLLPNNINVVNNPEFLAEGSAVSHFKNMDRIVIGASSGSAIETMRAVYWPLIKNKTPFLVTTNIDAELIKYASNSFLATKISFMNDMALFCEKIGADINIIKIGMSYDPRIGDKFLNAGAGYGGSCFPKDIKELQRSSKKLGHNLKMVELAEEINKEQKLVLFNKIKKHYGDLKGKTFSVWGLAFKPDTDDMREAVSIVTINKLLEKGAKIICHDPIAIPSAKKLFGDKIEYREDMYEAAKDTEGLIIHTEWEHYQKADLSKIDLAQKVIFDGRNIFSPSLVQLAGFTYYTIGRGNFEAK